MTRALKELGGYTIASGAALAVDILVLWLLVHFFSASPVAAATVSFLCGAVVAYQLSIRIAFRERRLSDRRVELLMFVAIGSVGVCINAGVIYLCVQHWGLHYLLGKAVAAGFTFTFNFLVRRHTLFVARRAGEALP